MRVLVCGGRDYEDVKTLVAFLDNYHNYVHTFTTLIHGGATGADALAGAWAAKNDIPIEVFPVSKADWKRYRNSAGPRRNQQMINEGRPDLVIAFEGGYGTADMMRRARRHGIDVVEVPQ